MRHRGTQCIVVCEAGRQSRVRRTPRAGGSARRLRYGYSIPYVCNTLVMQACRPMSSWRRRITHGRRVSIRVTRIVRHRLRPHYIRVLYEYIVHSLPVIVCALHIIMHMLSMSYCASPAVLNVHAYDLKCAFNCCISCQSPFSVFVRVFQLENHPVA